MNSSLRKYLSALRYEKKQRRRITAFITAMSVFVSAGVFWQLRGVGTAMTDEALTDSGGSFAPQEIENCSLCETSSEWEASLPVIGDNIAENIALIAESQLGYSENKDNFILTDDGTENRYYSRYGAWYGNPYGNWNTMFVYFCLSYAGAEKIPIGSGCWAWSLQLEENGLLKTFDSGSPKRGDVLLIDSDLDGKADRSGIIAENDTDSDAPSLKLIEGQVEGTVAETLYSPDDEHIVGYVDASVCSENASAPDNEISALEFSAVSESGIQVNASADMNVFPDDTEMTVTDVSVDETIGIAAEMLDTDAELISAVAVDISFRTTDGTEIEPADSSLVHVEVILPEDKMLSGDSYDLLHISDEGSAEIVESADVSGSGAVFDAAGFSVYMITTLDSNGSDIPYRVSEATYINGRYFGDFGKNTADNRFIVYIGDTLDIIFENRTGGYTAVANNGSSSGDKLIRLTDNYDFTWQDGELTRTGSRKSYRANTAGNCEVQYIQDGQAVETLYVTVKEPIYVRTEFDNKPTNKTREWLNGYGLTNYEGYVPNTITEPLLLRVEDSLDMYSHTSSGIWVYPCGVDEKGKWVDSIAQNPNTRITVSNENNENGLYSWTITGVDTGMSCIKLGEDKVFVQVIDDETVYNHADMEIAEGGQYTITNVSYENGKKVTKVTIYDAFVSAVNHAVVYGENDTMLSEFFSNDYKQIGGQGSTQYELTSAYTFDSSKEYQITDVEHVVFNVDVTLIPKRCFTVYESTVTEGSIDDMQQEVIKNEKFDLGKQQIIDAMNKCPMKNGLDFTIKPKAALVRVEALKKLDNDKTPPNEAFTFEMSEFDYSYYRMPNNQAHTFTIPNYDPTHTYEAYRINKLVGWQGWGDGIDGDAFWNTALAGYHSSFNDNPQLIGELIEKYADNTNTTNDFDKESFTSVLLPYLRSENAVRPDANGVLYDMTGDFILLDITGTVATAVNNENGVVLLDKTYTEPGTHKYIVREVVPQNDTQYIYDNKMQFIKVEVAYETDNDMTLSAVVTGNKPEFLNKVTYTLPATGGGGTIPYVVTGSVIIITSFAMLIIRKRKEDN